MDLAVYDDMSNDQIRRRLVDNFNQKCGPIVPSTRKLFLKKLARLEKESGDYSFNNNSTAKAGLNDSFANGLNGNDNKLNQSINFPVVKPRKASKASPEKAQPASRKSLPAVVAKPQIAPKKRQSVSPPPSPARAAPTTPQKATTAQRRSVSPKKRVRGGTPLAKETPPPPKKRLNNFNPELEETRLTQISDSEDDDENINNFPSPLESTALSETSTSSFRISDSFSRFSPKNFFSRTSTTTKTSTATTSPSKKPTSGSYKPLTRPPLQRSTLMTYSDSESETEELQDTERMTKILLSHRPTMGPNRYVKPAQQAPSRVLSFFRGLFGLNSNAKKSSQNSRLEPNERDNFAQSSNNVSRFLLRFVIVFFISIVGLYFGLKFYNQKATFDLTDYAFIEDKSQLVVPYCPDGQVRDCLKNEDDRKPTLNIVQDIRSHIDDYLVKYFCDNSNPIRSLDEFLFPSVDLKNFLWEKVMNLDRYKDLNKMPSYTKFLPDFDNALVLIRKNPAWNMKVDEFRKDITVTTNFSPNFSLVCQAKLFVIRNLYTIVGAVVAILTIVFSTIYSRHSKKKAYELQNEVDRLIEESIELLQSPDEPLSIPVLHIRDTLIPTADRQSKKYRNIWDKVVSHMEKSESRVMVEFRNIDGEDFKAWKWIGGSSNFSSADESDFDQTNSAEQIGGLKWQGTAFSQSAKKTIKTSPQEKPRVVERHSGFEAPRVISALTRFMKVRNYYDKARRTPNYKQLIRNSIIEKVVKEKGSHDIVHIGLDEDEKESLVYIKCRTLDGATDVFNALHGWWCENHLVSVRYLKEERYYQHFSDAKSAETPLHVE